MYEAFVTKNFRRPALQQIQHANRIIEAYARQGYKLTLRQLYYQFVAHDLFSDDRRWVWTGTKWKRDPNGTKNAEPNYTYLGGLISDARIAGLVDWAAIEDRTRNLQALGSFDSPADFMRYTHYWYRLDHWQDQPYRIEAWVEKEALVGVLARICAQYHVPYFACKGYVSQSEMYDAAQRFKGYIEGDQQVLLLHLGDHDPSGIDMTRDITDRLEMFFGSAADLYLDQFTIKRIALNYDQVRAYNPPPNPAKNTDTRFGEYANQFGLESWELDALEPSVIAGLIEAEVLAVRDEERYNEVLELEAEQLQLIRSLGSRWTDIERLLKR